MNEGVIGVSVKGVICYLMTLAIPPWGVCPVEERGLCQIMLLYILIFIYNILYININL